MNPFTNRGMVTDPADFIGRAEQMEEICTRLDKMESTSIVGERRIGKSSLLYQLALTGKERLSDTAYRFFYIDLQDARCHTALGFFQILLGRLGAATDAVKEGNSPNRNLIAFGDGIEALERDGQRIVLCLDEFENTFKHPAEFGDDFFDHLRSMVNVRQLALVTASRQTLQALSLAGKLTSPFYNLLSTVELKEFTEAEAREFIAVYNARVNFTDAELQFLFSYLDLHPLKLRILCDRVFKNRQKRLNDKTLVGEITKEYDNFIVRASSHLSSAVKQHNQSIEIFFSYSHKDESLRDELEKHLGVLKRQGLIESWHDRQIGAGNDWESEISEHLDRAQIILLLVSSDFISSDYCYDKEVKRAIERHERREAKVIPIILRPVSWEKAPFGKLQALPSNAKPVTTWGNWDEAFCDIAKSIEAAIQDKMWRKRSLL